MTRRGVLRPGWASRRLRTGRTTVVLLLVIAVAGCTAGPNRSGSRGREEANQAEFGTVGEHHEILESSPAAVRASQRPILRS